MMKEQRSVALDQTYLAQLYQQVAPKILDYVYRHIPSFQDAEDILVETFVAALESPLFASLAQQEQHAWLWRVARNKTIDTYRRAQRVQQVSVTTLDEPLVEDIALDPEQHSLRQEEERDLVRLIKRLSPLQQQVLALRFGEDLRCAQIAARVGKRESSIRSLLSRVINLLRRYSQEQEEGEKDDGTIE
jgi:RNA polymerase sigma factor (sigma-70 family)